MKRWLIGLSIFFGIVAIIIVSLFVDLDSKRDLETVTIDGKEYYQMSTRNIQFRMDEDFTPITEEILEQDSERLITLLRENNVDGFATKEDFFEDDDVVYFYHFDDSYQYPIKFAYSLSKNPLYAALDLNDRDNFEMLREEFRLQALDVGEEPFRVKEDGEMSFQFRSLGGLPAMLIEMEMIREKDNLPITTLMIMQFQGMKLHLFLFRYEKENSEKAERYFSEFMESIEYL